MRRWALDGRIKMKNCRLLVILCSTFSDSELEVETVRIVKQNIKGALKQQQRVPQRDTLAPVSHKHHQPQWCVRRS